MNYMEQSFASIDFTEYEDNPMEYEQDDDSCAEDSVWEVLVNCIEMSQVAIDISALILFPSAEEILHSSNDGYGSGTALYRGISNSIFLCRYKGNYHIVWNSIYYPDWRACTMSKGQIERLVRNAHFGGGIIGPQGNVIPYELKYPIERPSMDFEDSQKAKRFKNC